MTTIRQWFAEAPEVPERIFIAGQLVDWANAPAAELDREFDDGWGTQESTPFMAWSENWVYFVGTYDGAEWLAFVPRHPTAAVKPISVGGG